MEELLKDLTDEQFEDLLQFHESNVHDYAIAALTGIHPDKIHAIRRRLPTFSEGKQEQPLSNWALGLIPTAARKRPVRNWVSCVLYLLWLLLLIRLTLSPSHQVISQPFPQIFIAYKFCRSVIDFIRGR